MAFSSLANAVVVVVAALGSKSAEMEGTPNLATRGKKALVSAKAQVITNGVDSAYWEPVLSVCFVYIFQLYTTLSTDMHTMLLTR